MSLHTNDECWAWLQKDLCLERESDIRLEVEMIETKARELIAASLNGTVVIAMNMPADLQGLKAGYPPNFTKDHPLFFSRLGLTHELQKPLREQRAQALNDHLKARSVQATLLPNQLIRDEDLQVELSLTILERMGLIAQEVFSATDFEVFRASRIRR